MRKLKLEELGRISIEEFKQQEKFPLILVLDNIRSALNVGSIFRTADALNVEKVYLCGITAHPPHKEINKTAIGATASVEWAHFKDVKEAIQILKVNGYKILALEQTTASIPLPQLELNSNEKIAVILGNEVSGVSEEALLQSDLAVEIPQFGTKHSFNVTISAGIALWELLRKMGVV